MRRFLLLAMLAAPALAAVPTPPRPVTDPRTLESPANAAARPVPLGDIATSRQLYGASWSVDGSRIFVSTNLTGRVNLWRTDAGGSWPVQLTQSDEQQLEPTQSGDGRWLYFVQDRGGDEYYDVLRVPAEGGAAEKVTDTPDISESAVVAARGADLIAIAHKRRSAGQSDLAVVEGGRVRVLTAEADPQFRWEPVAIVNGGATIIAARRDAGNTTAEAWAVDVATGRATRLLGKAGTRFIVEDATADGRLLSVSADDAGEQLRAGVFDTRTGRWTWARPSPWEQRAGPFVEGGAAMVFRTNADGRTTLSRLAVAGGAERALALPPGVNAVAAGHPVSPDGRRLLVTHAGADAPTDLHVYDLAADRATPATRLAIAGLAPGSLPRSRVVTYRSFDGTLVSAVVTMPFNLARDGAAPAVVIPHGGPTAQALDGWDSNAAALASRGYVVIQPNFRGSTGYGRAFQKANYQDLGGGDLKDVVAAKDFLVASGFVDPKRVGIFGGSYGGFMTLMALGRTPDAFAAGVQYFGILNWRTMYRDQDERLKAYQRSLLGTPDAAPAVYDASSPLTYIRAARAPLLSIQGERDIRVPRGQAQEVTDILKAQGNVVETVFYPAEGHGFRKRENQLDALTRMVGWFDRHLKGAR